MNLLKHIGIVIASVVILIGVPLWCSGGLHSLFSSDPDAVSSASEILESPSGNFVVMINKDFHPQDGTLKDWITFFEGGDILYIFEDISCSVAAGDTSGIEMAESFRSRLPENQMKIKSDDMMLLASRADHGLYDVIIMSKEFADMTGIQKTRSDSMEVVEIAKET